MGSLWGLVTAIAYAITGVIIGHTCKKSHPLGVSLVVTAGTLLFFVLIGALGPGIHIFAESIHFGILIGVLFAIGNAIYYKALSIGPMAMVSVSCSLAPVIPLAFDIATGKAPSSVQGIGFLLVASGIWLMARRWHAKRANNGVKINPLLLVIPASLLFGVNDVLFELSGTASMVGLLLVIQLSKLIATLLLSIPVMGRIRSAPLPILKLLPLGVIYGVAWIALDWSARAGMIDITSALEYSSPVYVAMLAYVFLGERLSRRQAAGVLSAFTGILLMVALPSPSKTSRTPTACRTDCQPMRHPMSHRFR